MGKFDPSYDLILVNIPYAFSIGNNTVNSITYNSDSKNYSYPGSANGVISEYTAMMAEYSNKESEIDSLLSSVPSPTTLPSSYDIPFSSAVNTAYSAFSSVTPTVNFSGTYSSAKNAMLNTSDISSVFSAMQVPQINPTSIYNLARSSLDEVKANVSESIQSFNTQGQQILSGMYTYIMQTVPSIINTYVTSKPIFSNMEQFLGSVLRNVSPTLDYTAFMRSIVPSTAQYVADKISEYALSNLEITKKTFFMGYEKFAGRRIGMTNFIDIYTARETLKTVKDIKVGIYDKLIDAMNSYFIEYARTQMDLTKSFSQFTLSTYIEMLRNYISYVSNYLEGMRIYLATIGEVPKLNTSLYQSLAEVTNSYVNSVVNLYNSEVNKYNIAVGFVADVYRAASAAATQIEDRKYSSILATVDSFLKTFLTSQELTFQTGFNKATKEFEMNMSKHSANIQLAQAKLGKISYRYDRALEFLAHSTGIPNTVNRGLSKFEQTMLPISIVFNALSSIGTMALPFI